ncbi:MAG: penicillin-binding protein 2 [Candidatus Gracilibacteria bacterium]|nr:penicillin-binding protein 2 [Candidatus Gracilibacteria bacterium]
MRNKNNFFDNLEKIINKYPREYIVFGFFIVFSLIIVSKVFSYTVLNYDFYKELADKQQIGEVKIPVTRGNIYSAKDTIFATSVNLNDIAVDPMMPGDKGKLTVFLRDIVYKELCLTKTQKECYDGILKFLKKLEIEDFAYEEDYIKNLIFEGLKYKLGQTKVTSVLLETGLGADAVIRLKGLSMTGIYPNDDGSVYANPEEISSPESVASELSQVLSTPEPRIAYLLRKRDKRYIPIISKLSIDTSEEINEYLKDERQAIQRGILDSEKGISNFIILEPYPQRYYPEKNIASQVTGFIDNDGVGHYGLEGYFNDILKGNDGYIISRKDIQGRTIDPISLDLGDTYGEGARIYSTIDRNIQKEIEEILESGVKEYRANKGSVVVMNPKTGAIIAMANYPSYNPNNPGNVYELEKVNYGKYPDPLIDLKGFPVFVVDSNEGREYYYNGKKLLLRDATEDELGNPAIVKYKFANDFGPSVYQNDVISGMYEPGSIMKSVTVAIGIDTGEINEYDMYNDKGEVIIDKFKITNVSSQCLGYNTFAHALNYSCNVGMVRIAQKYGKALAYEYLNKFGFGIPTGITLEGEIYKKIESFEKWSTAKLFTSSYGLGISVTPLQMATAYSTLANGGLYVKPHIVDYIQYPNGKVLKYKTEVDHRVIKESTSRTMVKLLVDSINNGVASLAKVEGYNLAGKTGTSQIASKGGYETGIASTFASFAGFGPAEDPKFVVVVKLDRPRSSEYGGNTSVKLFQRVASYLLDYYEIPKKKTK